LSIPKRTGKDTGESITGRRPRRNSGALSRASPFRHARRQVSPRHGIRCDVDCAMERMPNYVKSITWAM